MYTKTGKLLENIISGLVIDRKCIASRIYNQINEKNTIYLNFMNIINQKLSKVGLCNKKQITTYQVLRVINRA